MYFIISKTKILFFGNATLKTVFEIDSYHFSADSLCVKITLALGFCFKMSSQKNPPGKSTVALNLFVKTPTL